MTFVIYQVYVFDCDLPDGCKEPGGTGVELVDSHDEGFEWARKLLEDRGWTFTARGGAQHCPAHGANQAAEPTPARPARRGPWRLIVTGSRRYRDVQRLRNRLDTIASKHPEGLLVIHGGHKGDGSGRISADAIADAWALQRRSEGWPVDRKVYEADWLGPCRASCTPGHRKPQQRGGTYCPAAGPYRNREMVYDGADECLAAPATDGGPAKGTAGCSALATTAGIPVEFLDI